MEAYRSQRLLDHLKEAGFYTAKDLDGITHALQEMRASVGRGEQDYNPHLLTLLEARIDVCEEVLRDLKTYLSHLSPELSTTHEKLVSILRCLSASSTRSKVVEPVSQIELTLELTLYASFLWRKSRTLRNSSTKSRRSLGEATWSCHQARRPLRRDMRIHFVQ